MTERIVIEEMRYNEIRKKKRMNRAAVGSRRTLPVINTLSTEMKGFTAFVLKFKASSAARL